MRDATAEVGRGQSFVKSVENELESGQKGSGRIIWSLSWYIKIERMMTWPRVMQ